VLDKGLASVCIGIEARILDLDLLAGEFAENEMCEDLTPSDRVAIFDAIKRKPAGRSNLADLPNSAQAAEKAGFSSERTMSNARVAA
jgi:hypothetical protein